jgi:hypothetical protein
LSCFALGLSGLAAAAAQASSAPSEVVTEPVEATATGVLLRGRLNPNGLPTTYYFAYSRPGWGECANNCTTETAVEGPLSGDTQQEVAAVEVTGLIADRRYSYVLVATNADGTTEGTLVEFTAGFSGEPPREVQTEPAEALPRGAKLKGRLDPGGLPTTYFFEYGRAGCSEGPDCVSKTTVEGPLSGDTQREVPGVEVTGLGPGHYLDWLVASNADGTAAGEAVHFTVAEPIFTPPPEGNNPLGEQGGHTSMWESSAPLVTPLTTVLPIQTTRPEASTGAQRRVRAMRACRHGSRRQRAICARQARRKHALGAESASRSKR